MANTNQPTAPAAIAIEPRAPASPPSGSTAQARAQAPTPVRSRGEPVRVAIPFDPYALPVEETA